jgi:tripartite-type tricarboxylate transporter receptor subunit TctC
MISRASPAARGTVARCSRLLVGAVAALGLLLAACGQATPPVPTAKPELAAAPAAKAPAAQPSPAASPSPSVAPGVPSPSLAPSPAAANPSATSGAASIPAFNEQAVADFYRGKTIHIVVGFGAGGGYDVYARLIAKYLGKYLPGSPNVIVDNTPGAGSAVALTQIYNTLPRDGTVIGSGDGTLALQQILGAQSFDFDNSKWTYVGAPSIYEYFYVVSKAGLARAGITRVEDHLGPNGKQLVVGNTGPGVGLTATQMMISIAGANIKNVLGYAGTAAFRLAMQQGEIDGFFTSWDSIKATESTELANGEHVLFVQFPKEPVQATPYPVRSIWEFARTQEDQQAIQYGALATHQFARAWVMAPGVPADRLAAMQSAFLRTLADADLLADAEKAQLDIHPLSGPQLQQIVTDFYSMPDTVKDRLRAVLATPT